MLKQLSQFSDIFQIWVNPTQTGGLKNMKPKRQSLLMQTKRILRHVTAGVLYLKHLNLD
jgi:hypothetical protein